MKRLFLLLAVVLGISAGVWAQKTEFQIGYGGYTQMDATDCCDDVNTSNAWGAVTAGVNFNITPKFAIGPSYTFSSQSIKHDMGNVYYHVIMLNAKYNYYRTSIFTLYAHVGLGGMVSHISPKGPDPWNKGCFAYQVTPLGATVDVARGVSMFGELGFGAQGLVQLGFKFKL